MVVLLPLMCGGGNRKSSEFLQSNFWNYIIYRQNTIHINKYFREADREHVYIYCLFEKDTTHTKLQFCKEQQNLAVLLVGWMGLQHKTENI